MISASVRAGIAFADGRLDAKYHCSPGVMANEHLVLLKAQGIEMRPVAGPCGIGVLGGTSRTKRVLAAAGEPSLPYLRPYDVFDYLPQPASLLSESGSQDVERLRPDRGTLLQTCSGRNLGPLAYADEYLSRFYISDDMLRLTIDDETDRFYVLAYLSTPTGQALLTRSKTGNVIDHLAPDDLASVEVPYFEDRFTREVAKTMREAAALREHARVTLDKLIREVEQSLPSVVRESPARDGWTSRAVGLAERMDAAYRDPAVERLRGELESAGAVRLGAYADFYLPNWYKRHYVSADHGRCIVSGRHVLQSRPVHLQYLAARALDYATYELGENTIAFGARGRAEDRMSQPALITSDRASWLGSENVMRVRPKASADAGWLFLSLASTQVQAQIRAAAYGAVVDVVDIRRLGEVLIPQRDNDRGKAALQCWQNFAIASAMEDAIIERLDDMISVQAGRAG